MTTFHEALEKVRAKILFGSETFICLALPAIGLTADETKEYISIIKEKISPNTSFPSWVERNFGHHLAVLVKTGVLSEHERFLPIMVALRLRWIDHMLAGKEGFPDFYLKGIRIIPNKDFVC